MAYTSKLHQLLDFFDILVALGQMHKARPIRDLKGRLRVKMLRHRAEYLVKDIGGRYLEKSRMWILTRKECDKIGYPKRGFFSTRRVFLNEKIG